MNGTVINIARIDIHVPSPGVLLESGLLATAQLGAPADSPPGTVVDPATGLMWTRETIATDKTWSEAKAAAAAVTLGGFTDWRLPTRKELLTLVDDTRYNPAINTDLFQCDSNRYWSSTVDAESPSDCAWCVLFYHGYCLLNGQGNRGRVRAVRSVSPSASSQ
jgi:hypothetical protein